MKNSTETNLDLIGATQEQERQYRDRHFLRMWLLMGTTEALEEIKNPEILKNLKQLIWYQRLEEARKLDQESELGENSDVYEKKEIIDIKGEMRRGWPSFEPGVTNERIFEYVFSAGNQEDLNLIRDINWFLYMAVKDCQLTLLPEEYIYIIVSDHNITPQKLRELFDLCSGDFKKLSAVLTAIDQGIIKFEELTSQTNMEDLIQKVKNKLPGFTSDIE